MFRALSNIEMDLVCVYVMYRPDTEERMWRMWLHRVFISEYARQRTYRLADTRYKDNSTNRFSGDDMKKLAVVLIAIGSLLGGCVAYEVPNRDHGVYQRDRDRDGVPNRADRDRDGDGVSNRQDRRPDDPRRY